MDKRFKAAALISVVASLALLSGCTVPKNYIGASNSLPTAQERAEKNRKELFDIQLKVDAPEGYEVYSEQALDSGSRYQTVAFRHTRKIGETPIDDTVKVPLPVTLIYAVNDEGSLISESFYRIDSINERSVEISFDEEHNLSDDFNLDREEAIKENPDFKLETLKEEAQKLDPEIMEDIQDFAYQADLMLNSPRFLLRREYSKAKRIFDDIERKHRKKLEGTSLLDEIRSLQAHLSFLKIGSSVLNQVSLEPARESIELLKDI